MSQKNGILFRNSVNGFNKSDVNSYIVKINSELEDADKKANSAKKELEDLKAEFEKMKTALDEAEKKIAEQEAIISAQYENIDSLKDSLPVAPVDESSVRAVPPDVWEKAELYDQMSSSIGNVMIDAKKNAEEVLSKAKKEADAMIEEASFKLSEASAKALRNITSDMSDGVDGCYREVTAYMNALQAEINRTVSEFSEKNREMNGRIKALHSSLSKNINSEMGELLELSSTIKPYLDIDADSAKRSV